MRLADAKTVAGQLGLTKETIYRWAQDGKLPVACRLGPKLRFDLDVIEEWVKKGGTAQ